jgi:hypothetical protein
LFRICVASAAIALIAFVFVAHDLWLPPNHDDSTIIVEAHKLLAGGRFYNDIMETNPPLIVFLTEPGVLLSKATGLSAWAGYVAWVCIIIVTSSLVAHRYLNWTYAKNPPDAALAAFIYLVAIALSPNYDFGQREHLAIMLFLPALLWFAAREAGRPSPRDAGCIIALVLAAVGLLLKPYLLLAPVILVVVRAATHRDWRMLFGIETFMVASAGGVYAALVLIFFPEWLSVASLTSQVYFGYDEPWSAVVRTCLPGGLTLAVVVVSLRIMPMDVERRTFLSQIAIAAGCFLASGFVQHKAWLYHFLPVLQLSLLLAGLLGLQIRALFQKHGALTTPALISALAVLGVWGFFVASMSRYYRSILRPNGGAQYVSYEAAVRELAAGGPWLAVTTNLYPAFPTAVLVDGEYGSRFPSQWMIPGIAKLKAGGATDRVRAGELQRMVTRFLVEDLERYRPALVAVKVNGDQALDGRFDFLAFFSEDDDFRRVWTPYRLAKSIPEWQFYTRPP